MHTGGLQYYAGQLLYIHACFTQQLLYDAVCSASTTDVVLIYVFLPGIRYFVRVINYSLIARLAQKCIAGGRMQERLRVDMRPRGLNSLTVGLAALPLQSGPFYDCTDIRDDSPGGACCTYAVCDFVKKVMPFFLKYLRQILRLDSVKPSQTNKIQMNLVHTE